MTKIVPDPPLSSITTLGVVTFGDYGENEKPLFRVNAGMPIEEALEHAFTVLFYSKKLAMEAALDMHAGPLSAHRSDVGACLRRRWVRQ
ncbi:DUF3077 domain-containing protein [Pseudomonas pergaminensis]|uniref:DUF3077 domain-containing protein n=1 Tax=Pseudomonas pergaminensis TaxID=2853159 RepID=UPI0034D5B77F